MFAAEISLVVCDNNAKLENLLERRSETPGLKTIIMMEAPSEQLQTRASDAGIKVLLFSEVEVSTPVPWVFSVSACAVPAGHQVLCSVLAILLTPKFYISAVYL